jgi:hypothetical protein
VEFRNVWTPTTPWPGHAGMENLHGIVTSPYATEVTSVEDTAIPASVGTCVGARWLSSGALDEVAVHELAGGSLRSTFNPSAFAASGRDVSVQAVAPGLATDRRFAASAVAIGPRAGVAGFQRITVDPTEIPGVPGDVTLHTGEALLATSVRLFAPQSRLALIPGDAHFEGAQAALDVLGGTMVLKLWNGSAWCETPHLNQWSGATWSPVPLNLWNGGTWWN